MSTRWARIWFGVTALCAVAGVAISIGTAVHNTAGHFGTGAERGFNTFAFFTIESNLIVAVTATVAAVRLEPPSIVYQVARLTGLVAITVTGVVYHVALAHLLDLESWNLVGDQLVHTVVPVLSVIGWLILSPRGRTSRRVAWWSLLFPITWLAFTLIRGAVIQWYPYHFIDVTTLGYAKAALNCFWVSLLFLALAAGATSLDAYLGRSGRQSAEVETPEVDTV